MLSLLLSAAELSPLQGREQEVRKIPGDIELTLRPGSVTNLLCDLGYITLHLIVVSLKRVT